MGLFKHKITGSQQFIRKFQKKKNKQIYRQKAFQHFCMKLLSFEQGEQEQSQSMGTSQISQEESLSNNVDQQTVNEQQNLNQLKFFDEQNIRWHDIIRLDKGQSSMVKVEKENRLTKSQCYQKIKKFQQKTYNQGRGRKEKMIKNNILKQVVMEDILGLIGEF